MKILDKLKQIPVRYDDSWLTGDLKIGPNLFDVIIGMLGGAILATLFHALVP
jgi:hypothetical protein